MGERYDITWKLSKTYLNPLQSTVLLGALILLVLLYGMRHRVHGATAVVRQAGRQDATMAA